MKDLFYIITFIKELCSVISLIPYLTKFGSYFDKTKKEYGKI